MVWANTNIKFENRRGEHQRPADNLSGNGQSRASSNNAPHGGEANEFNMDTNDLALNSNYPNMYDIFKRIFDIVVSIMAVIALSPFFIMIAVFIKCDSKGPVFFRQSRMTKGMRPFRIFKFRTMTVCNDDYLTQGVACLDTQKRVTRVGRFLRKYRIDELPQLFNIIRGEMSLVGPRPLTPKLAGIYPDIYAHILQLRPGLTGLATVKIYEWEEEIIKNAKDRAEDVYINYVLPIKLKYDSFYLMNYSFLFDLKIIWWTGVSIIKKLFKL